MAPMTSTPPRSSARRRPGRPRVRPLIATAASEPPRKRLRYLPGVSSGGGRFLDGKDDLKEQTGLTQSASRVRLPRRQSEKSTTAQSPLVTLPRARRDRPQPKPRYSSAAAAASAMTQNEGYKPREERSWEEFHQDLDIEVDLMVFGAEEVDGNRGSDFGSGTPIQGQGMSPGIVQNGASPVLGHALQLLTQQAGATQGLGSPTALITPIKRRPGRPPKRPDHLLYGLGSPPIQRIEPAPSFNPKERLNLMKPNYRRVDTFSAYEQSKSVGINYVDNSLRNVGYQESDLFVRPEEIRRPEETGKPYIKKYIRGGEGSMDEELDFALLVAEANGTSASATGTLGASVGRVEYDMDEQDERWLDSINVERKSEGVEGIRPAIFEITMTQIEKEWHALEKRIPKPNPKPPQTHRPRSSSAAAVNGEPVGAGEEQDTKCAVCDDGDCENTNAIVFCDGCDLAVHQECYGVPFIPEGQWLCRKCQLIGRNTPTCIFCPNIEGAFKQTNTLRWSHLLCAIWIPEVSLGNQTFMEPVMEVEKVPKQRWKLNCYICQQKMGACIQCSNKNCYLAFHVTCARRCQLFLKMKNPHGGMADKNSLKGFCDKHVPPDWRKERQVDVATTEAKEFYRRTMKGRRWADSQAAALAMPNPNHPGFVDTNEDAEAQEEPSTAAGSNRRRKGQIQKKIWRLPSGAPVVPQFVYHNVENALVRFSIRKRKDFVAEACKYWTLKREARRGAALLKRLQLQLDTFTSMEMTRRNFAGMGAAGGPKLQQRIAFAEHLEEDVEQIRVMCEKTLEREDQKRFDVDLLREIVDTVYFPIPPLLWPVLERIKTLNSNNKSYFRVDQIQAKLEQRAYTSVSAFATDLGKAFNSVIYSSSTDDQSASRNEGSLKHSELTAEQKDKKMRAKRIIKLILPQLLEAASNEADLGLRSRDAERHRVESILDASVRPSPESVHFKGDGGYSEDEAEHEQVLRQIAPNGQTGTANDDTGAQGDSVGKGSTGDVEMTDTGAEKQSTSSPSLLNGHENEATDSPAHQANSLDPITNGEHADATSARATPALPALSNSGSTNPSTTTHEPLTPPQSDKDLLAPLAHGGKAWYLNRFDPVGTTIHDELWPGREVLRNMSEELSELDEETMNGLVDDDEMHEVQVDPVPTAETLKAAAARKKRAQRKRRRAW